jgi:hypothetical protein
MYKAFVAIGWTLPWRALRAQQKSLKKRSSVHGPLWLLPVKNECRP